MLGRLLGDVRDSHTFGQVTIERRVLLTPKSTIPIANIAVMSSGTVNVPRRFVRAAALVLLAAGIAALAIGVNLKGTLVMMVGGAAVVAGLVALVFARTEAPCLSITSNDGHKTHFTGQRRTLDEVRRILSDKINTGDDSAVYRINFEKGIVQPAGAAAVHAEPVAGMLPGMGGPMIAATPGRGPAPALDTYMPASIPPPAPQLGNGYFAGSSPAPHVDYSQILAQIVDMQRFYAQRPDTQDIAERLNEMEYLMRSGTPTPGSRGRLNQLVGELSAILGAYPSVVQIFQQAARLAGF